MSELVAINDVILTVNPTDINIVTNRFVEDMDLVRESCPFTFSSPHGYTNFTMAISIDSTSNTEIYKLIKICTELDKFPFVWIKSDRLIANILGNNKVANGFAMYAVETWTVKTDSKTQGVVYLIISGYYFNHVPLVESFNFLTYKEEEESKDKWGNPKDVSTLLTNPSFNPADSRVFQDFFSAEIDKRSKLASMMLKRGSLSHLSFSVPTMYPNSEVAKQALANNRAMRVLDFGDDVMSMEITPIAKKRYDGFYYTDPDGNAKSQTYGQYKTNLESDTPEVEKMFLAYLESPLVNQSGLVVQEISITKRNKLAINKMQGYMEPMIQYMGKGAAQISMVFAVNSSGAYQGLGSTLANNANPAILLNAILANVDSQVLYNQRMSPFKNIKINTFVAALVGSNYFIVDNKIYTAKSDEQGRDMLYLNMTESDLTTLSKKLRARKVSLSPIKTSKNIIIGIIKDALELYTNSVEYKTFSTDFFGILSNMGTRMLTSAKDGLNSGDGTFLGETAALLKAASLPIATAAEDLFYGAFAEAGEYITPQFISDSNFQIDALIAGHEVRIDSELVKSLYGLNLMLLRYAPFFNPEATPVEINRKTVFDLSHLKKNIDYITKTLDGDEFGYRVKDGTERNTIDRNVYHALSSAFETIIYLSSDGDKFAVASAKKFMEELGEVGYKAISQIEGEAIPDLSIGESLGDKYLRGTNAQDIDPFFFLNQTPYLDSKTIKSKYDIINNAYREQFDSLNGGMITLSENYTDELKKSAQKLKAQPTYAPKTSLATSPIKVNRKEDPHNVIPIIEEYAAKYNIDRRLMLTMAYHESRYIPTARATVKKTGKPSTYRGLFQMSGKLFEKLMGISPSSDKWKDPRIATEAAAKFIKNYLIPELERNKIPVTPENIYLSHGMGPTGFKNIYRAYGRGESAEKFKAAHPNIAYNMRNNSPYGGKKEVMLATDLSPADFISGWNKKIAGRMNKIPVSSIKKKEDAQNKTFDAQKSATAPPRVESEAARTEAIPKSTSVPVTPAIVKTEPFMADEETEVNDDKVFFDTANAIDASSNKVFEGMNISEIDVYKESDQAQYRALRTGKYFENGLNLTIPTIKIYAVEGNENDLSQLIKQRKRTLIELYGFSDIKVITASEEDPVSLCHFNIVNPLSSYSDIEAMAQEFSYKLDYSKIGSEDELRIKAKSLRLVPGLNIMVKMGYGNNPNDLETVFTGVVSQAEGEEMISIIAEGHGRELSLVRHAVEDVELASGVMNSSTSGIINDIMLFPEILNFGEKDKILNANNPYAKNIMDGAGNGMFGAFGRWANSAQRDAILPLSWDTRSELFTNVFSPSIEDQDETYTFGLLTGLKGTIAWNWDGYTKQYPLYNTTPWEVLNEMQFRHPGTRSQVLNYDYRSTFFYGIKEQLYYAESPLMSTIRFASDKSKSSYAPTTEAEFERYLNLKPVADFHLFTAEHNIISNELSLNNKFGTQANIRWFDDLPNREDFETNAGEFKYYQMQTDDNLLPRSIRSFDVDAAGCDHQLVAAKYGQVALRKETEKMYDGKIYVIGNPCIKAGDFAYLNDRTRGLVGVIKIRECIHHFNTEKGFVTEITPGLYAEESSIMYSSLLPKLALVFHNLSESMISNLYASSLQKNSDIFTLMASSLDALLINAQARKEIGPYIYGSVAGILTYLSSVYTVATLTGNTTLGLTMNAIKSPTSLKFVADALKVTQTGISSAIKARAAAQAAPAVNNAAKVGRLAKIAANVGPRLGAVAIRLGSIIGTTARVTAVGLTLVLTLNPVSLIVEGLAMMAISCVFNTIEEIGLTRQPIRIYPLIYNGASYTVGLDGYEDNTWTESKLLELRKTTGFGSDDWGSVGKIMQTAKDLTTGRNNIRDNIMNEITESRARVNEMKARGNGAGE